MRNFGRALRIALSYRVRVVALFVCAACVGLLWGANIGTVYPLVEIGFKGQTPQQWIRQKATESQAEIDRLGQKLAALPENDASANERAILVGRIEAEQEALALSQQLQPYVDAYLPSDPFHMLALVVVMLLVGTALKSVFFIIHSLISDSIVGLATYELRTHFYRQTLKMDQAQFTSEGTSELMSRFTFDVDCVTQGLRFLCQVGTREPLKMMACFAGAAFICWRLLLISLIIVPVGGWAISRLSKLLKSANRKAMEGMSRLYGVLEETFQGIQVVRSFTMESRERNRFHQICKDYYLRTMRIARYTALTSPVTEFIGISTISITLLLGAYLGLSQETHLFGIQITERPLSIGMLLTFYGLIAGMSDPARKLSDSYSRLQRASAAADRIYALIDRQPLVADAGAEGVPVRHQRSLEFREVVFGYDASRPVLRTLNLHIPFGQSVAIVGPNGCGKSTMLQLLLRFYDPQQGQVLLDGVDLKNLRLRDLRRQIGFVTQEPILFQDTVTNNIRYGNPLASDEEVIAAAQKAHAHKFITEKLPDGYETVLAERGSSLSGGQRQRIALARAILRDPSLLILDEATSQIDLESEQLIHMVLEDFKQGRTTLIVTHRLSTLVLADRIVVMQGGQVEDVGTHAELLSRCDFYRRLHELQYRESA